MTAAAVGFLSAIVIYALFGQIGIWIWLGGLGVLFTVILLEEAERRREVRREHEEREAKLNEIARENYEKWVKPGMKNDG